ncbi:unnamed protein product [Cylindrotheca closterium]|uniref:Uncharacterized protein n=1 Tax=Cylindrotheca closterium TaxID=2856 RepID=A0AAD2PUT3_9STRA|nr:unnamed protein product [Cylindrotheca closterium]
MKQNSTLASEISHIWHFPSDHTICIELKNNTRCPRPAFLGRLSGPSLAMLDWGRETDEKFGPLMRCGSYEYQWLSAGMYFLEVIGLFCEDFGVNSLKRKENELDWLSFDFKHKCMEDPNSNRITDEGSYLMIKEDQNTASGPTPKGRWVFQTTLGSKPVPLHSRYQPQGCLRNPDQEICENPTDGTALGFYSFEWEGNVGERWRERINITRDSRNFPKVCFFGFSHSRELESAFERIGLGKHVAHVKAKYPEDITVSLLNYSYVERGCTAFIIAVAQWPGSRFQGFPYLFDRFYAGMKQMAETAIRLFADRADEVRVYLRSIHEIPIGERTGSCPMSDWRSPVVMHAYSHLVEKAVREIRERDEAGNKIIRFLDTSFIISPMWDSAPDWGHLPLNVTDEEALFMASVVSNNFLDCR